jgi:hypothetical protein
MWKAHKCHFRAVERHHVGWGKWAAGEIETSLDLHRPEEIKISNSWSYSRSLILVLVLVLIYRVWLERLSTTAGSQAPTPFFG